MISSDRLHTFAAFAEDSNLSRAARRLHLSQPAVHAQLKALTEEIGVTLYRRAGRGLALTKEGVELAAFARDLGERTRDLVQRLRGETGERRVVLAAGAGALVHLLAAGLRTFSRSRTVARVEVITADAASAVDVVRRGLAHVGVAVLDVLPPDLEHHTLARASQLLVLPRDHRLASRRSVRLADLAGESLVAPPEGGPQRIALDAALAARSVEMRVSAVARGWDVVLKLVELGLGLGIVNATCAIPKRLAARPLRELPVVTYLAFTRAAPRPDTAELVSALVAGASAQR